MNPMFKTGDIVQIRPEWDGGREPVRVIVELDADRGAISGLPPYHPRPPLLMAGCVPECPCA